MRPDLRRARTGVDGDDAAPGEPERDDVHLRQRVVVAQHHRLALVLDQAVAHHADLEGGPPHVRGDDVARADELAEALGADEPAHGARLDHADRRFGGLVEGQEASVGLHDEQDPAEALITEPLGEVVQVAPDHGPEADVQRDRGGALVLPHDRSDLVGHREEDVWTDALRHGLDRELGLGVGEAPDQAHADRLGALLEQRPERGLDLLRIDGDPHVALRVVAAAHAADELRGDDRRWLVGVDRVSLALLGQARPASVPAAHREQGVLEARGGQDAARCQGVVDDGVLGHRRAVEEQRRPREQLSAREIQLLGRDLQRVEDAGREVRRRGERLAQRHLSGRVHDDAVGSGATDVDADDVLHASVSLAHLGPHSPGQDVGRSCSGGSSRQTTSESSNVAHDGQQYSTRKKSGSVDRRDPAFCIGERTRDRRGLPGLLRGRERMPAPRALRGAVGGLLEVLAEGPSGGRHVRACRPGRIRRAADPLGPDLQAPGLRGRRLPAVAGHRDPVDGLCGLGGDQAAAHVLGDQRGIAVYGVAIAAAAHEAHVLDVAWAKVDLPPELIGALGGDDRLEANPASRRRWRPGRCGRPTLQPG